uniref:SOCS box domain-containing protein n=1 Tax=Trichogramma kaykai TaxID=54128 RepID=A0ABD2XMK3_9HYME
MKINRRSNVKLKVNLFNELDPLISNWEGQYPDLKKLFRREEMDWLLKEYVTTVKSYEHLRITNVLDFAVKCGYKDKPDLDKSGKPPLRRATPLHQAFGCSFLVGCSNVQNLFKVYDRYDVNYTDESGLTHFHVACKFGCDDVVGKFLEFGQNPNLLVPKSIDRPLHLALAGGHKKVVELLLKHDADPNSVNENKLTPLQTICIKGGDFDLTKRLFALKNNNVYPPVNTLLILANDYVEAKSWLERGAGQNKADGLRTLHIICKRKNDAADMAETLFKICDDRHQLVQVDGLDKKGRTPLQWAVANLWPNLVDVLLDHGADLSKFTFPTLKHFNEGFMSQFNLTWVHVSQMRIVSGVRAVVKRLEKRGYKLNRMDAKTITTLFDEYKLFKKTDLDRLWYDDDEFTSIAKKITMNPDLSLHDLVRLSPEKAEKLLRCKDYYHDLVFSCEWMKLSQKFQFASVTHLCHIMLRGCFYKRWALGSLLKLTHTKLPIFCYEMIIEPLTNKDLWHICLASPSETRKSL